MSNKAQEQFDKLNDDELQELYEKLLSFASFRLDFNDTQGLSAEDFVHKAIKKTMEGSRIWDPETNPDFKGFLKGCISSEISNHFNLKSTQTTSTVGKQDQKDSFFDRQDGGANILSDIEGEELRNLLFDELVEYDEELAELLFFQEEGYTTPEIVEELNYESRTKVYNARKRLRRACQKFLDQLSG